MRFKSNQSNTKSQRVSHVFFFPKVTVAAWCSVTTTLPHLSTVAFSLISVLQMPGSFFNGATDMGMDNVARSMLRPRRRRKAAAVMMEPTSHFRPADQISYVIEPFESVTNEWFIRKHINSGHVNLTITSATDAHAINESYNTTEETTGASAAPLFGDGALRIEYEFGQIDNTTNVFFEFGWILNASTTPPHNCQGATHLSLWYKFLEPNSRTGDMNLTLVLLDDSSCAGSNCRDAPGHNMENYNYFRLSLDDRVPSDSLPTSHNKEKEEAWQELWVDLRDQSAVIPSARVGQVGNNKIDLDRIRGWRIELSSDAKDVENDVATDGLSWNNSGIVLLDHLSCLGGGEMLGAAFKVTDSTFQEAVERGEWAERCHKSFICENRTKIALNDEKDEFRTLLIDYTAEQVENWGGFISLEHLAPGAGYYNLSQATMLSMSYRVMKAARPPSRAHMRIILLDSSDCHKSCDVYPGENLENYYSFYYILDEEVGGEIITSLVGDGDSSSPFWRTGWSGIVGNGVLDSATIKGYRLEINLDSQGGMGSTVSGSLSLGNFTAVAHTPQVSQDVVSSTETGSRCTQEPELVFVDGFHVFNRVEFLGSRCFEVCEASPDCLYAYANKRDCFLSSHLEVNSVRFLITDFMQSTFTACWADDDLKRGDFCDMCECQEGERTIDCRGRDLAILPKSFTPHRSANNSERTWKPRVLDLRVNPRLVLIGTGALDSIAEVLEVLLLPQNMRFVSLSCFQDIPALDIVHFETNYESKSAATEGTEMYMENFLINAVTDNSADEFGDVCCGRGQHFDVSEPEGGLTFCDLQIDKPGVDSIYEPFVQYIGATPVKVLRASSGFLAEAAESAEKCAEACSITDRCRYFSYDARWKESEHTCYLWENNGTRKDTVCCDPDQYGDVEGTIPGWTSGRPPRTRIEMDDAVIKIEPRDLELNEENGYMAQFAVSLGSTPLRGAVWIEPTLAVITSELDAIVYPAKVVLYDDTMTATVNVTVSNVKGLSAVEMLVVNTLVQSCDAAFTVDSPPPVAIRVIASVDMNQLRAVRYVGLSLAGVVMLCSLLGIIWTHRNRRKRIVSSSQPIFLATICIGVLVMGSSIIPLSIDDGVATEQGCNIACMMSPWLLATGFCTSFAALFSKIWRINRIWRYSAEYRKVKVTEMDVLLPFVVLLALNVTLLAAWTLTDPPHWVRNEANKTTSYGQCVTNGTMASRILGCLLLIVNFCALLLAIIQSIQARHINTEYSESKYVAACVASILQASLIGLPILVLVGGNPSAVSAKFFVQAGLIFIICMSLLLLLFIPKIIHLKKAGSRASVASVTSDE